ncbi:MAG: efflux RND transporter periplasmic adaptor subunit [Rhodothermales bacterium]
MKKRLLIFTTVGAASVLALWIIVSAVREPTVDQAERLVPAVAVSVSPPTVDSVYEEIRYLGTVEGESDVDLAFHIGGTLADVYVREGRHVRPGDRLAALDQPEMRARQERARAELEKAEVNLSHWEAELAIDERLLARGAVSRSRRDQTRLAYENALRARDAAVAATEEAAGVVSAAVLRATTGGVVGRIERTAGETVMPGQPVLSLSAGRRRVRVDVLEGDLSKGIAVGTPAVIASRTCGSVEGVVGTIDTSVREPFRSVRVYVDVPPSCLADQPAGGTAPVTFRVNDQADAVMVPSSAIDLRTGQPRVFRVADDGTADVVFVELGVQRGSMQQIIGAVGPDDLIVVSGATNLQEGDRLNVVADVLTSEEENL